MVATEKQNCYSLIMDIKDYLSMLSKNELISLLMQLSEEEIAVKDSLESKLPLTSSFDNSNSGKSDFNLSSDNENLVSRTSSPQEKINLFKSLFVGRQDVFALRWQNSKSGKSGYSPVCANKWLSGKCDMKKMLTHTLMCYHNNGFIKKLDRGYAFFLEAK